MHNEILRPVSTGKFHSFLFKSEIILSGNASNMSYCYDVEDGFKLCNSRATPLALWLARADCGVGLLASWSRISETGSDAIRWVVEDFFSSGWQTGGDSYYHFSHVLSLRTHSGWDLLSILFHRPEFQLLSLSSWQGPKAFQKCLLITTKRLVSNRPWNRAKRASRTV